MIKINNLPDTLVLCGFMGAGKSTIGRALADKLQITFLDLDSEIENRTGITIPEIFDKMGEDEFRSIEKRIMLELVGEFKGVLSLGGGALQNQFIVDHLKLNGLLIFIETPFSVILDRILNEEVINRPLLLDKNKKVKSKEELKKDLTRLYDKRCEFYRQAEITIKTDSHQTIHMTVLDLLSKIKNHVAYN